MALHDTSLVDSGVAKGVFWGAGTHESALPSEVFEFFPEDLGVLYVLLKVDLLREALDHVCEGVVHFAGLDILVGTVELSVGLLEDHGPELVSQVSALAEGPGVTVVLHLRREEVVHYHKLFLSVVEETHTETT